MDYILKNAARLTPDKITALGTVIHALGGEGPDPEPNTMAPNDENELISEKEMPNIDFAEVQGVQVDDGPRRPIKIYNA